MARQFGVLDPADSPVAAFAARLRELHAAAGSPSPRALAMRTQVSRSALYAALQGKALPNWATVHALVTGCGGDLLVWRQDYESVQRTLLATTTQSTELAAVASDEVSAESSSETEAPAPKASMWIAAMAVAEPEAIEVTAAARTSLGWSRWRLRAGAPAVALVLAAAGIAIGISESTPAKNAAASPVAAVSIPPYVPVPISSEIPATSVAEYVAQADHDCNVDQSNALHYEAVLGAATLGLTTPSNVMAVAKEIAADVGAPPGNLAVLTGPGADQLRLLVRQYDQGVQDIQAAAPALGDKDLPEVNRLLRAAEGLLGEANDNLVALGATNCQ